jgi:ATP-dependent Zn protease
MATRQEEIAHHEAAHAVVARLLNVGLTHVAIFPTDDHSIAGATGFVGAASSYFVPTASVL